MKKLWVAAVTTAMFLGVQAYGEVKSVNVVGVMGVTIKGDNAWTLLSVPMTKLPVARGFIAGNTAGTITADNAGWVAGAFAVGGNAVDELGDSSYYVEITSGAFEGRHFYIDSNTTDTLTLKAEMADVNPGELANAGYKIIPANRIRDIFGEPQIDVKLDHPNDRIYLMKGQWSTPIYYQDGGFFDPKDCWVQSGANVNDLVVDRDIGLMVLRRGTEDVTLSVSGEVSANIQGVTVVAGWSLIGGMSASPVAIGDADLIASLGGPQDRIYEWTGTAWSTPIYYQDGGFFDPKDCWVQSGVNVDQTFIIHPGRSYLVRRVNNESSLWERESPLAEVD